MSRNQAISSVLHKSGLYIKKYSPVALSCIASVGVVVTAVVAVSALKKIGDLDAKQLATGLVGVVGLTATMVAAAKVMGSGTQTIIKGSTQMVIFAAAIKVLASACEDLSMQETFLSWFNNLKTQLSGDVAGNLQLQIDKEEVKRILLSGFADGSKAFNEDGTVITSTADDGRTLVKTFTNNFLTMTTVLKSAEGGEIARMVKQFSSDGTLIGITTTYA